MGLPSNCRPFIILKEKGSEELTVTRSLSMVRGEESILLLKKPLTSIIGSAIFSDSFPNPFISSVERTGAAIFRRELIFARNRPCLKNRDEAGKRLSSRAHPKRTKVMPIEENVFIRPENIAKRQSFIAKEHPEVFAAFTDIIGGDYT